MYPKVLRNRPLKPYTTFHIGGNARLLTAVYSLDSLIEAIYTGGANTLILGKGSNVLVSDEGYNGLAVLNLCDKINQVDETTVVCESGLSLPRISRYFAERSLTGLEWACGIPATLGGALVTNAGAFGSCIGKIVSEAKLLRNGKVLVLQQEELKFAYRSSAVLPTDAVLSVTIKGAKGDGEQIRNTMAQVSKLRREKQPEGYSAGSIFCAADGVPAGKLIEECGLKGATAGGAKISEKHANFIISNGFALAKDVKQLIDTAKAVVFAEKGIRLKEEIRYIGDF